MGKYKAILHWEYIQHEKGEDKNEKSDYRAGSGSIL